MISERLSQDQRRAQRLARYDELRAERPHLFVNPPEVPFEILIDAESQAAVADECAARLRAQGKPEEYGDIGVIYEDAYVIALRDAVRRRDGSLGPYIRVIPLVNAVGAAILPLLPDGRTVLTRHFRHGLRDWHWEIPRGFADPGEDGPATAARELLEEIGVPVSGVELLGRATADGGFDDIYLARIDVSQLPADGTLEAFVEGIDGLRLVDRDEIEKMIMAGELTDLYTLAAFAFAVARGVL
ncbi:NUDIX hydrolase [Actinoplanes sp. NPDC049118]|uniref:NUDIX hydrolase n=1 Tax=Actinoplanes sp. NPDC049118 TaxID=3155769 RepID=UPI0033F00A53